MSINNAKQSILFFYLITIFISTHNQSLIIIDHSGDLQNPGSIIDNNFESGLTLQLCKAIKEAIDQKNIKIMFARSSGSTTEHTDTVIFINRLNPDLYIKFGFYPCIINQITLFYYLEKQIDLNHIDKSLMFYSFDQIYLKNVARSNQYAAIFAKIFQDEEQLQGFIFTGICAIPCKPLLGLACPALYCECGLKKDTNWQYLVDPIVTAIEHILS